MNMNFIGDILERDVAPPEDNILTTMVQDTEKLNIKKKPSRWKQRLEAKKIASMSSSPDDVTSNSFKKELDESTSNNEEELTEKEKVHLENLKYLATMSPGQIAEERAELMASIDPSILNALMRKSKKGDEYLSRSDKKSKENNQKSDDAKPKEKTKDSNLQKKVTFSDTVQVQANSADKKNDSEPVVESYNEEKSPVPTSEQLQESERKTTHDIFQSVHFAKNPKPESDNDYKLDINDPELFDKMHEKYFPDLPKDTEKLKWMQPVDPFEEHDEVLNVEELRFDFNGDIIAADKDTIKNIPTTSGLYHHSESPQLPGYTLKELAHLMRSKFNAQRSISIRTLGRILHKLGLHKYDIIVQEENSTTNETTVMNPSLKKEFEDKVWNQVSNLHIIPILLTSSDEQFTTNLSVRNYAIEALWLWRQSGGDLQLEEIEKQNKSIS
ncbi:Rba50 protein [Saccharomycopsis crataegensis]|uniref:Rba50 protein n=1 Tax=Saccharomycopsis crataegensis TaxID=43959 RepID=A0AAV5QNF4_9ASCO|nr:Rba50 protein [Saccharomycopsis crataegensis]